MTYHPEGGGESFLQLSDPAAIEATLTGLQCNTNYTITVVATTGEHRKEGVALQGELQHCRSLHIFNVCFNYTGTTSTCPEDSGKILLSQVVLL